MKDSKGNEMIPGKDYWDILDEKGNERVSLTLVKVDEENNSVYFKDSGNNIREIPYIGMSTITGEYLYEFSATDFDWYPVEDE